MDIVYDLALLFHIPSMQPLSHFFVLAEASREENQLLVQLKVALSQDSGHFGAERYGSIEKPSLKSIF
jgi:hypothetical protein